MIHCDDCTYNQHQKLLWKCKMCEIIELLEDIKEKL